MPVCSAELRPPYLHLQGARHRDKWPLDYSADQGDSGVAMHRLLPQGRAAPAPERLSPQRLTSDRGHEGKRGQKGAKRGQKGKGTNRGQKGTAPNRLRHARQGHLDGTIKGP